MISQMIDSLRSSRRPSGLRTPSSSLSSSSLLSSFRSFTANNDSSVILRQCQSFTEVVTPDGTIAGGKLYGRRKEEKRLRRAYESVCRRQHNIRQSARHENQNELVLISGSPGSGKTALANTLRKAVQNDKGYFVNGKFEQTVGLEPYEVFVSALTEYTDQLFNTDADPTRIEQVQARTLKAVGTEAGLLTDMIPALERLLGKHETRRVYGSEASNRFRFVFCKFVCALTKCSPLVIFLDDLQWADTASLELIRSLLQTPDMSLLVIGAHRSNIAAQSSEGQPKSCVCNTELSFTAVLRDFEEDQAGIRTTKIHLNDFTVDDVQGMLRNLLRMPRNETTELAELVCEQSHGNVFHVLQFLKILFDQGFLTRDEQGVWGWDDAEIRAELTCEKTMMDLVRQTVVRLPRLLQVALKLASCMGDEVDDSALDLLLQTKTGLLLEEAIDEGLLIFLPQRGGYRFAHDLVRQAVFEMIPEEERDEFHFKIGRKLWQSSSTTARDKNIFMIVALLNKGSSFMIEELERYKVAGLNLKAGEQAAKVCAYPDASRFLQNGIELLGANRWNDEYQLTLALYNAASEVEVVNGNSDRANILIKEVLEHAKCLEDKLSTYLTWMRSKGQRDNMQDVISIGLDVLRQLGEPLPTKASRVTVLNEFVRVRMALRGKSNEDLLSLPSMRDKSKIACMKFLTMIFNYSYRARCPYTALVGFRAVQLTLKFGLHRNSSVAFAVYGMMLCGLGKDVKAGHRFGQLAISLAEKLQSKEVLPRAYLFSCGIRHWSEPIKETLDDILYAVKIGVEVGDVETSLVSQQQFCLYSVFLGTPISLIEEQLLENIQRAHQYQYTSVEMMSIMTLQLIHCWTGRVENPARLSGEVMDFYETMAKCEETSLKSYIVCLHWFAMDLAYMFGDYKYANVMAERNRSLQKFPAVLFAAVEIRFIEGLIAIALARKGIQRRANMKIAKDSLKKMTKWAKGSPRSYLGKQKLLEAELLSLQSNENASALYIEAIEIATKEDYAKDLALAYERAGDYKYAKGDEKMAVDYWNRAIKVYYDWGAIAKSKRLRVRELMSEGSTHTASLDSFIE